MPALKLAITASFAATANIDFVYRWDPVNSELISEELNVAYPVVNGTPNLKPDSARNLSKPVPGADAEEVPAQPS